MAQHDTTEATAELAEVEARCDQILERLGLPTSCDITTFCRHVARDRQRPISLKPVPMDNLGQAVTGLWLAFPGRDVITYERNTTALHQVHIILHELCHLLCGHRPARQQVMAMLFPSLSMSGLLRSGCYSQQEEREAELLASRILTRTGGLGTLVPTSTPAGDPSVVALRQRLQNALED